MIGEVARSEPGSDAITHLVLSRIKIVGDSLNDRTQSACKAPIETWFRDRQQLTPLVGDILHSPHDDVVVRQTVLTKRFDQWTSGRIATSGGSAMTSFRRRC